MTDDAMQNQRYFLKDSIRKTIDFSQTDQSRGIAAPDLEKGGSPDQTIIPLPKKEKWALVKDVTVCSAIENRESRRIYTGRPIQLDELSFLLWATQGVRRQMDAGHALRTVPSAGCRHSFETYLLIFNVEGLSEGIYRYLPVGHALVSQGSPAGLAEKITDASFGQSFIGRASAVFVWTTIPYRMEWRYDMAAHRVIAMDAGHVCQNLYLACEAIDSGTCAIGAFDQEKMDRLTGVDGVDEFVIYMAPVGKISPG